MDVNQPNETLLGPNPKHYTKLGESTGINMQEVLFIGGGGGGGVVVIH